MNKSCKFSAVAAGITLACIIFTSCGDKPDNQYLSRAIEITPSEEKVSAQNSKFASDLLALCMEGEEDNVVVSPLSANLCLSMLANATAGNSQSQILDALGFEKSSIGDINSYNNKLTSSLSGLDKFVTLRIANAMWYDKAINPKGNVIADLKSSYGIDLFEINHSSFAKDVNKWCDKKTKGIIKNIMNGTEDADFALVNAIYFKGIWNYYYEFEKSQTKKDKFTNADGSVSSAYYMHNKLEYPYICADKWRAMSIPFGGRGFVYTVVLPDEGVALEEVLRLYFYGDASAEESYKPLDLKLPKYKVGARYDLADVLKKMGITDIFDTRADFSNLTDADMAVNLIRQSVSFEINEEGAEAAAVTVASGDTSMGPMVDGYELFYVDRPFIYMIRERSTGAILFMGCVRKM